MFSILYKFTVKPGYEDPFRHHWSAVTQWYYRNARSLGSRLHRASTGEFIVYAQWQTRAQWEQQTTRADAELYQHRQAMWDACTDIAVIYELEVTDDWLQGRRTAGRRDLSHSLSNEQFPPCQAFSIVCHLQPTSC